MMVIQHATDWKNAAADVIPIVEERSALYIYVSMVAVVLKIEPLAMCKGQLAAQGTPSQIITPALMKQVYGLNCQIIPDPVSGTPLIIPEGRHHLQHSRAAS